ncbi:MAG: permease [Gemmatimonadetes bacterium]|nr:permease [Gemmatimonadota bacterium]
MRHSDEELPLSGGRPVDDDVRRELEFHLYERARELEARGMSPERAMAEASASFGNREAFEAECKTIESRRRSTRLRADRMGALRQDIVVGWRVLRKNPVFTFAAILMLTLGIGANSAVFSIVNHVLLQPLPLPGADRLVVLNERHAKGGWGSIPWANFLDLEAQSRSFTGMAAYASSPATVVSASAASRVNASPVSAGFFKVFPIKPFKGRLLLAEEHRVGAPAAAVVSYAYWRDQLGAPAALDAVHIRMDRDYAVVGVLPDGFDFPVDSRIWTALELNAQGTSRTAHNWDVIGRLAPNVTPAAAERELGSILERLKPVYAPDFDATGAQVVSLKESLSGSFRTPLYLLLGASGLVLFAACVNLASAMLARGTARATEFNVRLALGATRTRLIRQLLTESALLAVAGCVAGLFVAAALLRVLRLFAPQSLRLADVHVDAWALGFAACSAALTTLVFGLFPALRLSGSTQSLTLRQGRGTAGSRSMHVWNVLVATEVALAVVLLSGSALLIKSFTRAMQNELGFSADSVTTVRVNLPESSYEGTGATIPAFHERLLERLRTRPGVTSVGFTNVLPLSGGNPSGSLVVEGKPLNERGSNAYAVYRVMGGDYFSAMKIPVLKGRAFRTGAAVESAPAVIVGETLARSEWPGQDPIGKRLRVSGMDGGTEPWYTVIGVVGDVRSSSPTAPFENTYWFDHRSRPAYRTRNVSYVVRSSLSAPALASLVRQDVASIDKQVPLSIEAMPARVARASAARTFPMVVLGAFALVALVMAVVGIYAVVAYAVAQRTREIGVRLALGARPVAVHLLILRSAMRAIVPGLVVGAAISMAGAGFLRSLLYGISPSDPAPLLSAVGVLGVAALLSSALPAVRATRVDPVIAMRAE